MPIFITICTALFILAVICDFPIEKLIVIGIAVFLWALVVL